MEDVWEDKGDDSEKRPTIIKSATDLQRLKLEKLMKHPDRPVIIPERVKERGVPPIPEFVRNVMGSSAGAGSGEFHVYRHLRRKEYARQKYMREKGERERLDDEYRNKLNENKKTAEEKTAKRRAKRLKKKNKKKIKVLQHEVTPVDDSESSSNSKSEDEREDTNVVDKEESIINSNEQIKNTADLNSNHNKASRNQDTQEMFRIGKSGLQEQEINQTGPQWVSKLKLLNAVDNQIVNEGTVVDSDKLRISETGL